MEHLTESQQEKLESAVFRRLIDHLQQRTDVQNIDMMNLSGFCRNCLAKWLVAAAEETDINVNLDTARQQIYGMAYSQWKQHYQKEATPEQLERFAETQK